MFFSIIVPCYNVGPAIDALLRTIADQLDDDCELVLVNDGSVDDTSARIRAFIGADPRGGRIVLEETPNAGAAKARALGLSLARGRFVFFCDSDDLIGAHFIATVRRELAAQPDMELMFFTSQMVTERGGALVPLAPKVRYGAPRHYTDGAAALAHHLRQGMYTAAVWTFVARRDLIARSGAAFTDRGAHEDHLFTLKVILAARLIVAVPDLLYRQKVREGSLTNSRKGPGYVIDRITAHREAAAVLRGAPAPLRRLYDQWAFHSILWLLRENRRLVAPVLCSRHGLPYFAGNPVNLLRFAARAARGAWRR